MPNTPRNQWPYPDWNADWQEWQGVFFDMVRAQDSTVFSITEGMRNVFQSLPDAHISYVGGEYFLSMASDIVVISRTNNVRISIVNDDDLLLRPNTMICARVTPGAVGEQDTAFELVDFAEIDPGLRVFGYVTEAYGINWWNGSVLLPAEDARRIFSFLGEGGGTIDDKRVKVSVGDTTAAFLSSKIIAGDASVTVSIVDVGGNEKLSIISNGGGSSVATLEQYAVGYGNADDELTGDAPNFHWTSNRQLHIGAGTPNRIGTTADSLYVTGRFEVDGIADLDSDAYIRGNAYLFDDKAIYFGNSTDAVFGYSATSQTTDTLLLGLPATSNNLIITTAAGYSTNWIKNIRTNPTLFIMSGSASTSMYIAASHDQSNALLESGYGSLGVKDTYIAGSTYGAAYMPWAVSEEEWTAITAIGGAGVSLLGLFAAVNGNTGNLLHGSLTDLSTAFADHPYYIAVNGTRAFTGNQSMGGHDLTSAYQIFGNASVFTSGSESIFSLDVGVDYGGLGLVVGPSYYNGTTGISSWSNALSNGTAEIVSTDDDIYSQCLVTIDNLFLSNPDFQGSLLWTSNRIPLANSVEEVNGLYNLSPVGEKSLIAGILAAAINTGTTYTAGLGLNLAGTVFSLSHLGIQSLTGPGADRILFWDQSANATAWLTVGSNLTITGTTITATDTNTITSVNVNMGAVTGALTFAGSVSQGGTDNKVFTFTNTTYTAGTGLNLAGTVFSLSHLGIQSLVDPNADRIMFWDDSVGAMSWLAAGTNVTITGTTITSTDTTYTASTGLNLAGTVFSLSHLGIQSLADPNADRIMFWDDSAGAVKWLTVGTNLTITDTTITASGSSTAYTAGTGLNLAGTVFSLSHLGIQSLTDPGGDRVLFWDESSNATAWLTIGTNLTITGTTIASTNTTYTAGAGLNLTGTVFAMSHLGIQSLVDPNADRIMFWDDSYGAMTWLTIGSGLSLSTTTLTATAPTLAQYAIGYGNSSNLMTGSASLLQLNANAQLLVGSTAPTYIGTTGSSAMISGRFEVAGGSYFRAAANSYVSLNVVGGKGVVSDALPFYWGSSEDAGLVWSTASTPDKLVLGLGSDSNAFVVCTKAGMGTDWYHDLRTNPTLFIQAASLANPAYALALSHDGSQGRLDPLYGGLSIQTGDGSTSTNSIIGSSSVGVGYNISIESGAICTLAMGQNIAVTGASSDFSLLNGYELSTDNLPYVQLRGRYVAGIWSGANHLTGSKLTTTDANGSAQVMTDMVLCVKTTSTAVTALRYQEGVATSPIRCPEGHAVFVTMILYSTDTSGSYGSFAQEYRIHLINNTYCYSVIASNTNLGARAYGGIAIPTLTITDNNVDVFTFNVQAANSNTWYHVAHITSAIITKTAWIHST